MNTPNWLYENTDVLLHSFSTTLIILIILLGLARLYGLRSFAKFTPVDFAVTVCIGSVLSSVIMSDNDSIIKAALVIATLLGFQALFGLARIYLPAFKNITTNKPIYLIKDGIIQKQNIKKVQMTLDQVYSKVRLKGYGNIEDIYSMILESTGDISIVGKDKKINPEIFSELE